MNTHLFQLSCRCTQLAHAPQPTAPAVPSENGDAALAAAGAPVPVLALGPLACTPGAEHRCVRILLLLLLLL